MRHDRGVDVIFALCFGMEAVLVVLATAMTPWAKGAYFSLGPGFLMTYGFVFPAILFLLYNASSFAWHWWKNDSFAEARRACFRSTWVRRSVAAFWIALLANLAFVLTARVFL